MSDYESVLCVKHEVFVYKIPPRSSNRGYRAADWQLDTPDWTGRLRVVAKGKDLIIKLEDKVSGELFAKCPVDTYPGLAVEAVLDSSRYFVLRLLDDTGRAAFVGMGFQDRGDSFDLNVALQDHFKHLKQEKELEHNKVDMQAAPKLDLSFKEGQTIKLNLASKKADGAAKPRPQAAGLGGGLGLLPPPPSATHRIHSTGGQAVPTGTPPLIGGFSGGFGAAAPAAGTDAAGAAAASKPAAANPNWVNFD